MMTTKQRPVHCRSLLSDGAVFARACLPMMAPLHRSSIQYDGAAHDGIAHDGAAHDDAAHDGAAHDGAAHATALV